MIGRKIFAVINEDGITLDGIADYPNDMEIQIPDNYIEIKAKPELLLSDCLIINYNSENGTLYTTRRIYHIDTNITEDNPDYAELDTITTDESYSPNNEFATKADLNEVLGSIKDLIGEMKNSIQMTKE